MIIKEKAVLYLIIVLCIVWSAYRIFFYNFRQETSNDVVHLDSVRQQVPPTQVRIHNPVRNVGQVQKGGLIAEAFIIENIGNNPLTIGEVIPDCTCTNYSISERNVPIGSHTILTLFVDTKNRIGTNSLNTLLTLIRVSTLSRVNKVFISISACLVSLYTVPRKLRGNES